MLQSPGYKAFRLYCRLMAKAAHCRRFSFAHPLANIAPCDGINYAWWAKRADKYEHWAKVIYRCIDI